MHLKVVLPVIAALIWATGSFAHGPDYTYTSPGAVATGAPGGTGGGATGGTGGGYTGGTGGADGTGGTGGTGGGGGTGTGTGTGAGTGGGTGTPPASGGSIASVIAANSELSTLNSIINTYPALLTALQTNAAGTFLAPSNDALANFITSQGGLPNITEDTIADLLSYHSLPLSYSSANLSAAGGAIAQTRLLDAEYANLAGTANVVFASAYGSTGQEVSPSGLKIYSGIGGTAGVTKPDLPYDGGLVHIIDQVLHFPRTCTKTAETGNLSTLLGALQKANLTEAVDTTAKFTCFAPTNEAFEKAGINITALSPDQLGDALKYHSIVGDVGYSTAFEDGKQYQTLLGVPVTAHKRDGQLFINDVAVQTGNVIMANGVAHVLSGVLSPPAAGAGGNGTTAGSTGSGASSLHDRAGITFGLFVGVLLSLSFA